MNNTTTAIDTWLSAGPELALDWHAGVAALSQYAEELEALRAGASYAELGIGHRRAETLPTILTATGQRVEGSYSLRDHAATPAGSIAHLKLTGVMRSADGISSRGVSSLISDMTAAAENPNIVGVLFETNSGGGEVTAAQQLLASMDEYPKAIVAWVHLMASGAVYGTLPADEIIASNRGAQIGSIGTMITLPKNLASTYNDQYQDIYADKSHRKNESWRAWLNGDLSVLRRDINTTNDIFHAEVAARRPLRGNVEDTLSGAMFYAAEAKRRGLIDSIGGMNYAIQRLQAAIKRRKK